MNPTHGTDDTWDLTPCTQIKLEKRRAAERNFNDSAYLTPPNVHPNGDPYPDDVPIRAREWCKVCLQLFPYIASAVVEAVILCCVASERASMSAEHAGWTFSVGGDVVACELARSASLI